MLYQGHCFHYSNNIDCNNSYYHLHVFPLLFSKKIRFILCWTLENTILYIPCLLIDLVHYIRKQYRITKPILFLLAFDIIFIIIYFNLSRIEKTFKLSNSTTLLKDPFT